jgi:biopolymer transport protein ExbB
MSTQSRAWRRWACFLCMAAIWGAYALTMAPRYSWAQDEKPAAEEKAADAGDAKPVAEKKEGAKEQQSFFIWIAETSGLIGLVILCCSIYFVAQVSRLFYEFRMPIAAPPEIIGQCEELLAQRDFKGIYAVVKDDDSIFSRALATGIAELPNGLAEARDVMDRVGESIVVEMEKKISILAVLGTLGPMIGLLGTLKGMIGAFSVIALSDTQLKASQVAGAISEALVLTFEGVALSVPSIFFFTFFKNRMSHISTAALLEADQFLRHFAHAARAKGPAAGAPAGAPAAKAAKEA